MLQSNVLATCPPDGSHTAQNNTYYLLAIAEEFAITNKVIAVVHDGAANMVAVSARRKESHGWNGQVRAAHMLQTCLRHTFENSAPLKKLLAAARHLVGHFHHSAVATENLLQEESASGADQRCALKVIQDVPSR